MLPIFALQGGERQRKGRKTERGKASLGERLFLKHLEEKLKLYLGILSDKKKVQRQSKTEDPQTKTTSRVSASFLQQESMATNAMDSIPEKNMSEIYQKCPTEIDVSSYSEIWTRALVTLNPSCALLNIYSSQALLKCENDARQTSHV